MEIKFRSIQVKAIRYWSGTKTFHFQHSENLFYQITGRWDIVILWTCWSSILMDIFEHRLIINHFHKFLYINLCFRSLRAKISWWKNGFGPSGLCAPPVVVVASVAGHCLHILCLFLSSFCLLPFTHFGRFQQLVFWYASLKLIVGD